MNPARPPSGALLLALAVILTMPLTGCLTKRDVSVKRPASGTGDTGEGGSAPGTSLPEDAESGTHDKDTRSGRRSSRGRNQTDDSTADGPGGSLAALPSGDGSHRAGGDGSACARLTGSHAIRPGETLWRISRNYGVSLELLARCNGVEDVRRIVAGNTLLVPGEEAMVLDPSGGASPLLDPTGEFVVVDEDLPETLRDRLNWPAGAGPSSDDPIPEFLWPVPGVITSPFGRRRGRMHTGLDLRASAGTRVRAARDGTVIYSGNGRGGYGNLVVLSHGDGWFTFYAHNSRNLVDEADQVRAGDTIALVGKTGNATAPHLHFEIRRGQQPVNPAGLLNGGMLASKER